jgi:hypothetical protein
MKSFENQGNVNMQAGKFFETAVFKSCTNADSVSGMNYKDSLDWVKKHQPEKDFKNPDTLDSKQLSKLRSEIVSRLPHVDEVLRFYTAIGSSLDILHGIDGVFELGEYQVTVDLTLNPEKTTGKADVIVLADDEDGLSDEAIQIASKDIAEKFKEKIVH